MTCVNLHATAIVIGTEGYLFLGPSGAGKTTTALSCMASARRIGLYAALVADDRVDLSVRHLRIVARGPAAIAGLAELRGVGPIPVQTIAAAVIHHAVLPVRPPFAERVAPEDEAFVLGSTRLALRRLPLLPGIDPLDALTRFCLR